MRKKSHIALAVGLVHGLNLKPRMKHRLSFYVGSIFPDLTPSFITRRHCISETFTINGDNMIKFLDKYDGKRDMTISSSFRMGIVMHHIADYFTYPHNTHFPGTLKDHCSYEEVLKKDMYKFIGQVQRGEPLSNLPVFSGVDQIQDYILEMHARYMQLPGNTENDCSYAYETCAAVMASLLLMAEHLYKIEIALA